ncbi:MAG: hypothetical protein IKK34_12450 [Clostridia bacterium]|nr:hypothetical protein [Clostridia bacterium]
MNRTLLIESAMRGMLFVNGQFCGPMERDGQAFPLGQNAEIYVQLFPFGEATPLAVGLEMREGRLKNLYPKENAFALLWPDGIVQLELRMQIQEEQEQSAQRMEPDVLLRYLHLRLAGDPRASLLRAGQTDADAPDLSAYYAAVPMRFAGSDVPDGYALRAGLVRRTAENAACVDTALAQAIDGAQGRRLIGRVDIVQADVVRI